MKRVAFLFVLFLFLATKGFSQEKSEFFGFLDKNLFNQEQFSYEFLESELQRYIDTFPRDDSTGLALRMLYQIKQKKGDCLEATLVLLKAASVFNERLNLEDCIEKIRKNLYRKEGIFRKEIFDEIRREAIQDFSGMIKPHPITASSAFRYISLLKKIKSKRLSGIYLNELNWYLRLFPGIKADTVLCWKGDFYFDSQKYVKAAEDYQMVLKIYPNSPLVKRLYLRLVDIYSRKKIWKYKEAAALLKEYMAKYPRNEWLPAQIRLLQIDAENLKNYDEAYEQFAMLMKNDNQIFLEEKIYYHLSNYFWDKGDLAKAKYVYEQFKKRYPNNGKIKKFSIYKAEERKK